MTRRGDVVLIKFPFTDVRQAKVRPAVIVQNDRDNQKIRKTVVAMITGNLRRLGDPSHFLIDPTLSEGAGSGLSGPSAASCNNLHTVEQSAIIRTLGHLSDVLKRQRNDCLKAALELPRRPSERPDGLSTAPGGYRFSSRRCSRFSRRSSRSRTWSSLSGDAAGFRAGSCGCRRSASCLAL